MLTVDPFDQRQQIALHALAGDISPLTLGMPNDFVYFIQKDNAVLLYPLQSLMLQVIIIDQRRRFLIGEQSCCLPHLDLSGDLALST